MSRGGHIHEITDFTRSGRKLNIEKPAGHAADGDVQGGKWQGYAGVDSLLSGKIRRRRAGIDHHGTQLYFGGRAGQRKPDVGFQR